MPSRGSFTGSAPVASNSALYSYVFPSSVVIFFCIVSSDVAREFRTRSIFPASHRVRHSTCASMGLSDSKNTPACLAHGRTGYLLQQFWGVGIPSPDLAHSYPARRRCRHIHMPQVLG